MAQQRATLSKISITDNGEMDAHDLAALTDSIDELYRNIDNSNIRRNSLSIDRIRMKKVVDIVINDTETLIPHGLGVVPKVIIVLPKDVLTTWRQTRSPDSNYLYLIATSAVTVDIVVQV